MTSVLRLQIPLATPATTINNPGMHTLLLLVAGLCLSSPVMAADAKTESKKPVIEVQQLNSETDLSGFQEPDYRVHKMSETNQSVPTRFERNRAIKVAGLEPVVKEWDEVDRDVLYMRAKNLSMKDLQKDYPKIKSTLLKRLKKAAESKKAQ